MSRRSSGTHADERQARRCQAALTVVGGNGLKLRASAMHGALLLSTLFALVIACTPQPGGDAGPFIAGHQPGFPKLGGALPAGHTRYDNASLADLLVRLTHDLEWGGRRPSLQRYEVPVRVGMTGPGSARYVNFLDRYLAELRARTGIAISRTVGPHNLRIQFVPGRAFRAKVPQHFCVVAPGNPDWARFRDDPIRLGTRAFETAATLDAMSVFIPDTVEPYLVRTCLIEEIAQALGPANDLYGLGPSIFNDDAAHIWPTALDYLILRVLYQPELRTGLSRRETRSRARDVLDRLNPAGQAAPPLPELSPRDMADWAETLRGAFSPEASSASRRKAARAALMIARRRAPGSAYHCHSLIVLARKVREPVAEVLEILSQARRICVRAHGSDDIRIARLQLETARATFREGRAGAAFGMSEPLAARLAAHGQAERLVALYALQAASLRAIQQGTKSFEARRRAREWGAYALGRNHPDVLRLSAQ